MALFDASHPFPFFDYFRVPYRIAPPSSAGSGPDAQTTAIERFCGRLWQTARPPGAATLAWLRADTASSLPSGVRDGQHLMNGSPFFGHVVPDAVAGRWLTDAGEGWRPVLPISDATGRRVASVWEDAAGSLFLPFDPGEVMRRFWSERYQTDGKATVATSVRTALLRAYYALRPAMPRSLQIALRRVFTRVQQQATFPRWPIETALHDLYEWLFGQLAAISDRPVPWLDLWPDGHSCALVLTHDVETSTGCRDVHILRDVERSMGHRSSWNFVPLRYSVDDRLIQGLTDEGCEIGVHGVLHDGRDLGSLRMLNRRLPTMREYAARWNAVGFRTPATQRTWEWMPLLGFDYDSSYHDTAPYEPTPGGCCSYLPYFNGDMVELPITVPQDHTVYTILQQQDETVWLRKAAHVRGNRGMVLVLTHPDYADDPRMVRGYRRLLQTFEGDPSVWRALPREVSAWWRRRAASALEEAGGGWRIRGPAAPDGGIRYARVGEPALAVDDNRADRAVGQP